MKKNLSNGCWREENKINENIRSKWKLDPFYMGNTMKRCNALWLWRDGGGGKLGGPRKDRFSLEICPPEVYLAIPLKDRSDSDRSVLQCKPFLSFSGKALFDFCLSEESKLWIYILQRKGTNWFLSFRVGLLLQYLPLINTAFFDYF